MRFSVAVEMLNIRMRRRGRGALAERASAPAAARPEEAG
jgi:hypothetical protein